MNKVDKQSCSVYIIKVYRNKSSVFINLIRIILNFAPTSKVNFIFVKAFVTIYQN